MENLVEWNGFSRGKYSEKTRPGAILSTTNPTFQTQARTRPAAVGSQRLTAWAMEGHRNLLLHSLYHRIWRSSTIFTVLWQVRVNRNEGRVELFLAKLPCQCYWWHCELRSHLHYFSGHGMCWKENIAWTEQRVWMPRFGFADGVLGQATNMQL
jgi:hypothetical protein